MHMIRLSDEDLEPFKERYRRAWMLHRDTADDEQRQILEREMDSAQNAFTMDQWKIFRCTLPGFEEYWDQLHAQGLAAVEIIKQSHNDRTPLAPDPDDPRRADPAGPPAGSS